MPMAKSIKVNNPYIAGVVILFLLFAIWFIFGPLGHKGSQLTEYIVPVIVTVLLLGWYYKSFRG